MTLRIAVALSLLLATTAFAQGVDPLRNVSGTAASPGGTSPWIRTGDGAFTVFHAFSAHLTHASEVGPDEPRSELFSTNWFGLGAQMSFGDRAFLLARGRVSLEPYTIPDDDGYPQTLQFIPADAGGPLVDRMRAHDLLGEAAVQFGFRPSSSTLLHVYGAVVGDPALGPPPAELRPSGIDFAEAPYSYEIAESFHDSTSVVTAGFATRWFTIEGSKFHDAVTFGDHTEIDNGDMDSTSARFTLTPTPSVAIQVSQGTLGEDAAERKVSSASLSYGTPTVAVTALWTRREQDLRASETAYGFELALRGTRNTFMGRAEWVDRPQGFPETTTSNTLEQTTHFAVGYLFDVLAASRYRAGLGVNIDYHTQSHELPARYGHKPQAIYAFVRLRSGN